MHACMMRLVTVSRCPELHELLIAYIDGSPAVSSLFLFYLYVCNYTQIVIMNIISLHQEKSPSPQPKAGAVAAVETEIDIYVLERNYQGNLRFVFCLAECDFQNADTKLQRLILQFFLWKSTFQFNLHPEIPISRANHVLQM